jgi:hypothetical protein
MSIEYDIIEDKQFVLAKGTGVITGIDVIKHLDELASDDRYISPMKKLIDYRFVESLNISQDEAISIALKKDTLSTKFRDERCAFVTPGNRTYGTSRVHQSLVDSTSINIAVFRQMKDALDWLDVELDTNLDEWLKKPIK